MVLVAILTVVVLNSFFTDSILFQGVLVCLGCVVLVCHAVAFFSERVLFFGRSGEIFSMTGVMFIGR